MGKYPPRSRAKRLANMAMFPQREPVYEPPPKEECEPDTYPLIIGDDDELRCRWLLWRETFKVDFAIVHVVRVAGEWHEVARIDCEHGDVHHHQLKRSKPGDSVGVRTRLELIPVTRGWETVDKWYGQALTLMYDNWEKHKRIWGGDSE